MAGSHGAKDKKRGRRAAGDVRRRKNAARIRVFRATVWKHYHEHGRHDLPWRKTKDPYKILVSEVMLQQTQVPRVIEKYKEFLNRFPTVQALAKAPLSDVLKVWSGLGYNRRAKYLRDAAREIVRIGNIKEALAGLLPGVGPYTRAAVRVFAFNEPHTMLETNIRAAFIHHFHKGPSFISDKELVPLIERAAGRQDPRTWHSALMDYGVYIKKLHKNPARRSSGYKKQSKFEGSLRQVRGAILRELHKGPSLLKGLPFEKERMEKALARLVRDGLIVKEKGQWRIA